MTFTEDIFFFIAPAIIITALFAVPYTRNILDREYSEVLTISSGYLLALIGIKCNSDKIVFFNWTWEQISAPIVIISILMTLIGTILRIWRKGKLIPREKLQQSLNNLKKEYYKLCSDNLKELFNSFFTKSEGNGRVSIYKYEEDKFILIGRYSNNPIYNKTGRESYPSDEGFISIGWTNGEFIINNLPVFSTHKRLYIQEVSEKCKIGTNTLNKLPMKSRSFYIKRIDNEDSRNPLGIIVFEQMSPNVIDGNLIATLISQHCKILSSLFKSMKSLHNI